MTRQRLEQSNQFNVRRYFRLEPREEELMSRCSVCNSKGFVEVRYPVLMNARLAFIMRSASKPTANPPFNFHSNRQVPKPEILLRADIPPKVKANVATFWSCVNPECNKLFWEARRSSSSVCVCMRGKGGWCFS